MTVTIDQIVEQGDKVVARWTSTMTHKGDFLGFAPSGKKATITGTSIQRISGGKIVEGWDNWDQLGLLVQIGAVPAAHFVKPAVRRSA
jgi:predicted ester cyclase